MIRDDYISGTIISNNNTTDDSNRPNNDNNNDIYNENIDSWYDNNVYDIIEYSTNIMRI